MNTKKYVLEMLESNRGESISGASIAEQLKVSRNAVWKAIKVLKEEGYTIEAVTNKGYRLCENSDILSVQGMLPYLSDKELASKIHIYSVIDSTNTRAKEMALAGASHGSVVMADSQAGGKGRYGRNFFSPAGHGIYMSFVLRPSKYLSFDVPTLVTAYAAVVTCEAIEGVTGKQPQIKWVNDLFLAGKKICGISTEAVIDFESGTTPWIVLGIGINFTEAESLPCELKQIVGTVFSKEELGEKYPPITRSQLAANIINRMTADKPKYPTDGTELLNQYRKRLMMLGAKVTVTGPKEPYEAVALDIDNAGQLIIEKSDGEVLTLATGEISIKM
jgi:BirA family biotin operon repressor/biotin-[acetyl-CoA-carboxylase] ligase